MPRVQQQGIEKETGRRKVHHVEAPRPAEDAKLTSLSLQELLPVVLKKNPLSGQNQGPRSDFSKVESPCPAAFSSVVFSRAV